MAIHEDLSNFIWQIADLLRGPYRPPQYERVMLPLTVLRRFDCVLEGSKERVVAAYEKLRARGLSEAVIDRKLNAVAGERFHNHSPLTFEKLKGDPDHINEHLQSYIDGFSAEVRDIFEKFEFTKEIEKMHEANVLYLVVSKFCDVDLHPKRVDNIEMGLLFENLIRRFNEAANETAGDYFTPRDVIQLMVGVLFAPDDDLLTRPGTIRTILDPACGTGGMLAEAQSYLDQHHQEATLYVFGQDYNKRAYATAASDLLMKGHENSRIEFGDTLLDDKFEGKRFDYFLANPPFGVDWKKQRSFVKREHETKGFAGRFGAGMPRVNDGSLLFLQHMLDKFERVAPDEMKDGSRLAIVFSGSPLFSGGAGSGESNIRKWIIENDWLEAIIALPEQMFYNTGIGTYIWVCTNHKETHRQGKIQLIDARDRWQPLRRSLGDKRRKIEKSERDEIVRLYGQFADTKDAKTFDNADFGYTRVTVERPLRLRFQITTERKAEFLDALPGLLDDVQAIDEALGREPLPDWNAVWKAVQALLRKRKSRWKAKEKKLFRSVFAETDPEAAPVIEKREALTNGHTVTEADRFGGWFLVSANGTQTLPLGIEVPKKAARVRYEADTALRDYEYIPLKEDVDAYFRREVLPYVSDAWMDRTKDRVGYEINFNRHFYTYDPPRPLEAIDADLKSLEEDILHLLQEVTV